MKIRVNKIEVDKNNPFENDMLDRSYEVEHISSILTLTSSPSVLTINSPWGQGKTVFLEMLRADLEKKECNSIYFSAWDTDFADDPLLAFIGEIDRDMQSFINTDDSKSKAWSAAKKATSHVVKKGIPMLAKIATHGILDTEKAIEGALSNFAESTSKDLIENYSKTKDEINKFKESIEEVFRNQGKTSLYIFIDELDRCRPTYAISLLERIKHIMDIEGLVFILAMDKVQLGHSIKAIYGQNFDSEKYLKRFFDIEYTLQKKNTEKFIDKAFGDFGIEDFFSKRPSNEIINFPEKPWFKKTLISLTQDNEFSLRDIEQLIAKINLILKTITDKYQIHPELFVFLVIAKEINKEIYINYINEQIISDEIINLLYKIFPSKEDNDSITLRTHIEASLIAAKHEISDRSSNILYSHIKQSENENNTKKTIHSKKIVHIVRSYSKVRQRINLDEIVQRIETLGNLNL